MQIAYKILETRKIIKNWEKEGLSIGLVPTMGYLHQGHESLIKKARKENDRVIVSIFINPIQFGPNEDLDSYPRNIEKDTQICKRLGVDLVFNPESLEMYTNDFYTFVDINTLSDNLCGKSRPTHFRGVCTVVNKLFNILSPTKAYFGQKDAQQLAIIKKMVQDLNIDIEIISCPIIREEDGLAKSSRNSYLNEEERKSATILIKSLLLGESMLKQKERNPKVILQAMSDKIHTEPLAKIDYINIVDKITLKDVGIIDKPVLIVMAVFIGNTRLIDNITYNI